MSKYNIEGNIDFFAELYKSLDIEDNQEKTDEDDNLCLITNQPLIDKFYKMKCGHKFNYVPLYLDIKNHKQKFNGMESHSGRLRIQEIRCPYCRKKQNSLLPYYEELGLPKLQGVNCIVRVDCFDEENVFNNNISNSFNYKKCEFAFANKIIFPNGCYHLGTQIKTFHNNNVDNFGDEKYYCWFHKKEIIKKYKQEIKDKLKKETNKIKEEIKQKEKDDKQIVKDQLKATKKHKIVVKNVVLGPSIITDISCNEIFIGCDEILKSGPNKGKPCGCKIVSENICKRHFSLKHKEFINNN